jgi:hypothetical protein
MTLKKIEAEVDSSEIWIAALRLSTQLRIQGLRDLSIRMLSEELPCLKKIELAAECKIQDWLLEGYTEVVTRRETISEEDEEQLGWDTSFKLFGIRHRRLEKRVYYTASDRLKDIESTLKNELADAAMFDDSPISYLRPNLRTAINPDVIQRDKLHYHDYTIFSVNFLVFIIMNYVTHFSHRCKTRYSGFLAIFSRKAQMFSGTCFDSLLLKVFPVMDLAMIIPFFSKG